MKNATEKRGIEDSQYEFSPRQRAMYEAAEENVSLFGQYDQGAGESGAHYAAPSPFAAEGMVCANCVFYEGPRGCELVSGDIDPEAICKLWIIPETLLATAVQEAPARAPETPRSETVRLETRRSELHNIREVRHFGLSNIEVREDSATNTIHFVGYASVFNHDYEVTDQYGTYTERIAPGAFTRTLGEAPDVVMNLNHGAGGTGLPVARTKSGTLKLTQDDVGLRVSSTLDLSDPDVQAIQTKMRRGDLDEMSFAFRVNSQEWSEQFDDRTITEVNLARGDVSIVTFGANPATFAAIRSEDGAEEDPRSEHFTEDTTEDVAPVEDAPVEETVEEESQERVATITEYLSRLVDARENG